LRRDALYHLPAIAIQFEREIGVIPASGEVFEKMWQLTVSSGSAFGWPAASGCAGSNYGEQSRKAVFWNASATMDRVLERQKNGKRIGVILVVVIILPVLNYNGAFAHLLCLSSP
jgi:hypothetical protein